MILMGTNDYNNAVPLGRWFTETAENVEYGHGYEKRMETRMKRQPEMNDATYRGRINIALDKVMLAWILELVLLLSQAKLM